MAWIFLIKGAAVNVFTASGSAIEAEVDKDPEYAALKEKADAAGFLMKESANEDEGGVSFFVGVELHEDRHIYQGQTVASALPDKAGPDDEALCDIVRELERIVGHHTNESISTTFGVVLNQFD